MKRARFAAAKKSRAPKSATGSHDGDEKFNGADRGFGDGGAALTLGDRLRVYRQVSTFRAVDTSIAAGTAASTGADEPSPDRRGGFAPMDSGLLRRMTVQYVRTLARDADTDWRHLKAWCDASLDDPLTDSRPARGLPTAVWAYILAFGDVHAMRAASEVSRLMRHTTLRPEAWGSAHLPLREPDGVEWFKLRAFLHDFPMALRSAPRVRIPDATYGFRLLGDLFRWLCPPATPVVAAAVERTGVVFSNASDIEIDEVSEADISADEAIPGTVAVMWERPVARRFVLRPNRLLRDLALEIELDHKHVCLLPRLFPNLERLHLHGYTDSRESLDVAVETLLGGLPRLASLTLGDECRGDSERGDSALPLPRHMTELRVLSSDIEWDYLREIDEPKDDRDDRAFRLCLAADLHPNFTALRLENSHTARLLSPSAPSMSLPAPGVSAWPPLRCLGLSGGTLMPGVALVDLLRIPTLEHVALSHMNLYPNKAWIGFSSVATTGEGVCDGGGGGGDGGDDDGGGVGGDDDGGDKALAVAVSVETSAVGVVGCRRLDLHNCALSRTAMRNLLRLYPRLAEVRILFLPRYPQCTSAAEFASAESEARPIGVDDILEAIADTAALRDGHLAYVHLPMTSGLAVFGPPTTDGYGGDGDSDGPGGDGAQVGAGIAKRDANISESGDRRSGPTGGDGPTFAAAPDDRDRPQCRCRTKCVSCACVHAEVVCGDACHGAVSEIAIAPRAVSGATPSKSKKAAGSATPRQAIRAAAVAIGGWPCRNKVRGERPPSVGATIAAEAAVAPVFVAHNRLAVQCRVLAIECPGAARARFSPTSLIVLPTSARAENDEATTTTPPPMKAPTPSGKRRDASRSLGTQSSSPSQFSLAQHVCIEPLLVAGLHGADPTVARFARFDASLYLPALARIVASASTMRRARGGAPCIVQFSEPGEHHSSWHRALEPYSAFNGVAPRLEFRQHCGRQPDGVGNKEDGDSGGGIDRLNVGERPRETSGVYSNACLCGVPVRGWTQSVSAPVKSATPTKKSTRPSSSSAAAAPPSVSARVTSPDQLVCGATHFVDLALYRADNFYA